MIWRTLALVLLFIFGSLARGETFVYLSVAAEKRIAVYQLDSETGKLTHKSDWPMADGEPGALTVDPGKRLLLAAIRSTGKLASFRLDTENGKLTHINTVAVGPDPAHISTDRTGRYLFTAYYVDAKVTVHAIGKDGALSDKPIQSIPTADKAHAIVPDPSNRFAFVPHTGPNAIFPFAFDAKIGKLSANTPAKIMTPKNTGPRHLAFHPTKPIAYVDNEQGSGITSYAFDEKTGTLSVLIEGRCPHFARREIEAEAHIGHFLGTFADQQNDDVTFGMIVQDALGHLLQQCRFSGSGRCDDDAALPLSPACRRSVTSE
jgi:6-phosphogluconolactonase